MKNKTLDPEKASFIATNTVAQGLTRTESSIPCVAYPPEDPTRDQQMRIIEISGTLDFWNRPEEDGYTETDGEPI